MNWEHLKTERPIERKIANVTVGDILKRDGITYEVTEVYSHYVVCKYTTPAGTTLNECFTVGDLVMMGKESPLPNEHNCFEI